MQNPIYVAIGGKKNNRTLAEAEAAARKLALVGISALAIVAFGNGGQIVEQVDFEANEIDASLPANLMIRTSLGNGPDKDSEGNEIENSVPDAGEYMNVDAVLDLVEKAANPIEGIRQLVAQNKPGITDAQVNAIIESMPGVAEAKKSAVLAAWKSA